jgi:hypothetical protein
VLGLIEAFKDSDEEVHKLERIGPAAVPSQILGSSNESGKITGSKKLRYYPSEFAGRQW